LVNQYKIFEIAGICGVGSVILLWILEDMLFSFLRYFSYYSVKCYFPT